MSARDLHGLSWWCGHGSVMWGWMLPEKVVKADGKIDQRVQRQFFITAGHFLVETTTKGNFQQLPAASVWNSSAYSYVWQFPWESMSSYSPASPSLGQRSKTWQKRPSKHLKEDRSTSGTSKQRWLSGASYPPAAQWIIFVRQTPQVCEIKWSIKKETFAAAQFTIVLFLVHYTDARRFSGCSLAQESRQESRGRRHTSPDLHVSTESGGKCFMFTLYCTIVCFFFF